MRTSITGMKLSLDGKIEGAEGMADWVQAWSDDFGLMSRIDSCVLGAGMYAGYEQYWTGIQIGKDIYLVSGARTAASAIDAGLLG